MERGTVKFFNEKPNKLYGFIIPDNLDGKEIFFHLNNGKLVEPARLVTPQIVDGTPRMPKKNERVIFERRATAQGPKAVWWVFEVDYKNAYRGKASAPAQTKELLSRRYAGVFDLPVEGPTEERSAGPFSSEYIGGAAGIGWSEYFQDSETGVTYKVRCSDGVYGGKASRSDGDLKWLDACYHAIIARCFAEVEAGHLSILISLNERRLMQGFAHVVWLESSPGAADGKQSSEGLSGGPVGHCRGVPIHCDPKREDQLPPR